MSKIRIVTDSAANLPEDVMERYQITLVPLSYLRNGVIYSDRQPAGQEQLVSESSPATYFQPSVALFSKIYRELKEQGAEQIISLHTSNLFLGVTRAAQQGSLLAQLDATCVDSETLDAALGQLVLTAAQMAEEGATVAEILQRIEQQKKELQTYVFLPSTARLRLTSQRLAARLEVERNILDMYSFFELEDGQPTIIKKGRTLKHLEPLIQSLLKELSFHSSPSLTLSYVGPEEMAEELAAYLQGHLEIAIETLPASPYMRASYGRGAVLLSVYH